MINLSPRGLEVLAAVAETGSFAAAANRLGIAQPSVSQHVQALERRAGTALFLRRRGRSAVLTEAGERVLAHARTMLSDVARLSEALEVGAGTVRRILFACQRPVANAVLPPVLASFARAHPEYELALVAGTLDEVVTHLRDGTADLGCFLSRWAPEGVASRAISVERYALVAAPSHPLAGRSHIDPDELSRQKFVRAAHRSGFSEQMADMLREAGIGHTPVASRATESGMVRELAAAGVGIWCTLAQAVRGDIESGALVELHTGGPPMTMDLRLATGTRRLPAPGARLLAEHIESTLRGAGRAAIRPPASAPA
ncbi:HTH-type transcriptional regulator CysL [Pigmentiphaga humi]|uniref:HTH-type transcriptional regulator CysL n=1 Tax=Pigmentiphaga humi TaxID=2478468 RepID=A0A3P4B4D9_9BURK|nr:LysR family transcriptional regulator [Pigmentiphaga humi]VCU71143.1 HTH-type transcriptional regulator CysL [Pigmentiphaga humi]